MTSAPHRSSTVPVRRRKRHAAQCQAHPDCTEKATRFCLRCMYVCDEHQHGDCCKAVLS